MIPFLAAMILARTPDLAERAWGSFLGPFLPWLLSQVSGQIPFSVIELVFAAWFVWRLADIGLGAGEVVRKRRHLGNASACFGLVLLQDLGIGLGVFYLAWGMNYARPPVEDRLGWDDVEPPAELATALAERMVDDANAAYLALHDSEDAGEPTSLGENLEHLDDALEEGWLRATRELGWEGPVTWRHGPFKRLVISPLVRRAGLSGFYSPFTGEANVVRSLPAISYPQVVAHEKAHQRGIAPEDEANFLGWLATSRAPDPHAQYSALIFAQRQLLRMLLRSDPERGKELLERRLPGVQRDVDDLHEYWSVATGRTARISQRVNDAYLKTNRVEGGVAAYGRSVELLIRFAAARGDSLGPAPDESNPAGERNEEAGAF